ncbi:Uncharacterized protein TCM_011479 [Theobroma cacao]|uniref:Uncharacterized protein n=1 Tax=Theobroma cacao TaxID=3641 RepID=A0A061EB56_THECC|nr:Uncharacterized protein TCM_011479 [Theobroma cacao]
MKIVKQKTEVLPNPTHVFSFRFLAFFFLQAAAQWSYRQIKNPTTQTNNLTLNYTKITCLVPRKRNCLSINVLTYKCLFFNFNQSVVIFIRKSFHIEIA